MTNEAGRNEPVGKQRRVVLIRRGDQDADLDVDVDACCEGLLHSASGGPLDAAIEAALAGRQHGVSVRLSEELLAKLDMLVEAGMCESRSAAATFLIHEGVEANADLFQTVERTSQQIADLREALRSRLSAAGRKPKAEDS